MDGDMTWILYAIAALAIWNFAVFCLYGFDKHRAKRGGRRVSERVLLLSAALLGSPGALFGMYIFRHKTKKAIFKFGVPLLFTFNIIAAVLVWEIIYGL